MGGSPDENGHARARRVPRVRARRRAVAAAARAPARRGAGPRRDDGGVPRAHRAAIGRARGRRLGRARLPDRSHLGRAAGPVRARARADLPDRARDPAAHLRARRDDDDRVLRGDRAGRRAARAARARALQRAARGVVGRAAPRLARRRGDRGDRPGGVAHVPPHRRRVRPHRARARCRAGGPRAVNLRGGVNSANPGPALAELHRRLRWVALVGIGAFALLVGRLWQLQVMRGESYYERTVSNVIKERYLPSVRGKILDRNGVPLADNRPAFNIYATPKLFTPEVKEELARMLALSDDELQKIDDRIAVGKKRDAKQAVLVLEDQGRDRAALVEQQKSRLPGVEVHHEPYRYYPQ